MGARRLSRVELMFWVRGVTIILTYIMRNMQGDPLKNILMMPPISDFVQPVGEWKTRVISFGCCLYNELFYLEKKQSAH